jgi:hypothetical protein
MCIYNDLEVVEVVIKPSFVDLRFDMTASSHLEITTCYQTDFKRSSNDASRAPSPEDVAILPHIKNDAVLEEDRS